MSSRRVIKDCLYDSVGFEEKSTVRAVQQILDQSSSVDTLYQSLGPVLKDSLTAADIRQFAERLWDGTHQKVPSPPSLPPPPSPSSQSSEGKSSRDK
jgi:hypothetical protein